MEEQAVELVSAPPSDVEEFSGDERATGVALLERAALSADWIHRRAEEIVFLERRSWRRAVTLYFTLPAEEEAGALRADGGCLVPLAMLAKRRLTLFHITDETGRMIPAFTDEARERICIAGLLHLAETVCADDLPDDLAADLRLVVRESNGDAHDALDRVAARTEEALANADDQTAEFRRATRGGLLEVAGELADNFLLIAPLTGAAGRQRILRFSYEEPAGPRPPSADRRYRRYGRRILRWIGWRATKLSFHAPALADVASFNIELEAPPGLQLSDPELEARDDNGEWRRVQRLPGSFGRVHLSASEPGREGRVVCGLRLRSETVVRAAWMNAAFATVILTIGGFQLHKLEPPGTAAALLLIVPSFMSLYLGQRTESAVSTLMAFRVKLLGTIPAICAFLAAGLVQLASGYRLTGEFWWLLTGIAALSLVALSGAWWSDRWRISQT